jgi:hypothetical protein
MQPPIQFTIYILHYFSQNGERERIISEKFVICTASSKKSIRTICFPLAYTLILTDEGSDFKLD